MQDKIQVIEAKKEALERQIKAIINDYADDPETVAQLELAIRIYEDVLSILSEPSEEEKSWIDTSLDGPSLKESDIANLKGFKKEKNGTITFQFTIHGEVHEATATYKENVLNLNTVSKFGEEDMISLSSNKDSIRKLLHIELLLNSIIGTQRTLSSES